MLNINNKKMLSATIICVSLFQMGMVALSPVISSITTAFPGTSELSAQMAMTFLNLILVITALFSGAISKAIGRKRMTAIGMALFILVGIAGYFFTLNIWAVYCWSALLGMGTGLFVPSAASMLIDYFSNDERKSIAGKQTAAVNLGGVILSLLSGVLAAKTWNSAYLVFLAAIPVLFMCLKYIPQEKPQAKTVKAGTKSRGKIPLVVWLSSLRAAIFALFYFTFSTNISLLLTEKGLNATSLAGAATACFMLGGTVCGLLFAKVFGILKGKTDAGAFALVGMSFMIIYFTDSMAALFIAAFIGGGSLSFIFPFYLMKISGYVAPEVSVISTSLVLSVGPNLGSFLTPMVITNLSGLGGDTSVVFRFFVSASLALVAAVLLAVVDAAKNRQAALYSRNI